MAEEEKEKVYILRGSLLIAFLFLFLIFFLLPVFAFIVVFSHLAGVTWCLGGRMIRKTFEIIYCVRGLSL